MKPQAALATLAALTIAVATAISPASAARGSYVIDDAHMLSATAVAKINQQVGDFNAQTGKEVVVVTTDSLGGTAPLAAIERSFAQNQVNGVEIMIAKAEKQIQVNGDRASRQFFPSGSFTTIAQTMRASFKAGDFDGGVENGVGLIINTYRGHESSINRGRQPVGAGSYARSTQHSNSGGSGMGWLWWVIILAVIFFVIRGIFRAIAGPRMGGGYGPGYGGGGPGYGGGFGGGGGGFWSGMLGGLGGAFLGNELFGNRGGGNVGGDGGSYANTGGTDPGTAADASGFQSDAGQIDTSNTSGGGWGDSGGGDSGGGGWGGGDSGGGGGDSGGGW